MRAILTDIEGTTSAIAFVKDVLFPHARAHLPAFVRDRRSDPTVAEALAQTRELAGDPGLDDEAAIAVLVRWIDEDRKATPLKTLQGLVWEDAYTSGALRGHVYDDAAAAMWRWRNFGLRLYVYSSGSIAAQRLIFGHSVAGDLRPLFSGYFDTTTGPKTEAASYTTIAETIGLPPASILFLSDLGTEIAAAKGAGMQTAQLARPQDGGFAGASSFPDFDAVEAAFHLRPGR